MVDFVGMAAWRIDVVNVVPLLHRRYSPGIAFVAGLRYGYSTLVLVFRGVLRAILWRGGATNKSQRVNMRIAALITRARAGGIYDFPARGTSGRLINPFLRCQRLRASFLPRAFAGSYPAHGSCGGALAEVFAESATLDLATPHE